MKHHFRRANASGTAPNLPSPGSSSTARAVAATQPGSRAPRHDPRWPTIAAALADLRQRKRFAVRIVDADCAAGSLLLHAVQHARALGFTAIEGRGIDGSPALIGHARAAARTLRDPAIGVVFDRADAAIALRDEYDLPADLILWNGPCRGDIAVALSRAGARIIFGSPTAQGRSTRSETCAP